MNKCDSTIDWCYQGCDIHRTNLLKETLKDVGEYEILYVLWWDNNQKKWCSWEDFCAVAATIYYDSGFGIQAINGTLVLVGKDFWFERHEYDGSEWWELKKYPQRVGKNSGITTDDICERRKR